MPKKKSEIEKPEEEQEEKTKEETEESPLEEEIGDIEEKIDTKQFQNFMQEDFQPIPQEIEIEETKAPVLERIGVQQEGITDLEWDLMQSTDFDRTEKTDENDPFKYNLGAGRTTEEPKYTKTYEEAAGVSKVDLPSLGREPFSERLEVGRMTSEEKFESVAQEQYNPARFQDTGELGKEKNPNEKKEVKYTPSKY